MRIKRITRAVSVVMLLAMLIGMLPMTGVAETVTAETTAATETTAPEPETVEATETSDTEPAAESATETQTKPSDEAPSEEPSEPEPEPETEATVDPPQEPADLRYPGAFTLGYHLNRSNTLRWGGIYAAQGAGSVSYTWQRNNGTWANFSLQAAGTDNLAIGIVHYMPYTDDNDPLPSVFAAPVVYCIEPEKPTSNNQMYDREGQNSAKLSDLLSADKINAIKLACAYGWPHGYTDLPNGAMNTDQETGFKYQFATQIVVWEIVMGLRNASGTFAVTDSSLKNHFYGNPWSSYYGSTNNAFKTAYDEISARLARHNVYPSFASSTAASAPVHSMAYNSSTGKYTITLTDTNEVLSPDFDSFSPPSGITVTKNGNTLTITATEAALANGEVTVSMTGRKKAAGTTYVWTASSQQTLMSIDSNASVPAYFKLQVDNKTVSLKKTTSGSADVLACIQDNPLYSLQGAVYEIHQGSATGPVVETLTTNSNGEATGTHKYDIGTTLYAVEVTAPSGYLLNTTPVKLTVSAGNTVFNVSDTPTFDPNRVVLNKTGTDTTRIKGAVFKFEFYASTWANPDRLLRTWYLQSDDTGLVKYDDAHLATGYNSDPIYKPNGTNPQFPLGCVVVKEVKAADGYVLPNDNDGKVFLFIKQREEDRSAYSFWGNGSGAPLTEQNPRGIYHIENDADPEMLTAINTEAYGSPFSIQKIDPAEAPLEGAVFRVDYFDDEWFNPAKLERTWYFKTDSNGYFTLENQYLADDYTSSELFPTDAIPVGIMRVREITAPEGYQLANITGIWRVKQAASGSSTVNSYWAAGNGETPTTSYGDSAYVLDAEPDKLYVKDAPNPGTMTMRKSLPNGVAGSKEGYAFRLYRRKDTAAGISSATYYGKSDEDGNVYITDSSFNEPDGKKVYTYTGLVDGTYLFRELLSLRETQDTRTQSVRITTTGGITPSVDLTFEGDDLSWDTNGDCTISGIQITGLNGGGMLTIEITNAPLANGSLRIVKVDRASREPLAGAGFRLYDAEGNQIAENYTDQDGCLEFSDLALGAYEYQEFEAPEGFALDDTRYPFSITAENPEIEVTCENEIAEGSIRVRKIDEKGQPMANMYFLLEYSLNDGMSWLPVNVRDDSDPVMIGYTTNDDTFDGIAPTSAPHGWVRFDGLAINNQLCNIKYRLTEVKTKDGYQLLTEPVFEGYLTSELTEIERTAVNHPIFQMPKTGSGGFTAAGIVLGLSLLAALLLLLYLPKKREECL